MADGKKTAAIAVGLGAVAALVAALSGGSAHAEEAPKEAPKSKVDLRVSLANKFAKIFGVPASLILAIIAMQSSNRANAYRANKRGGAWGYGQMTLTTAKEIWPRAKAKIGKTWNETGQGLLDPTINIGLTAYYLSLWYRRYKANPYKLGWILAAYAYVLGPGRVRKALPNDKGKLPSPLPSDFAVMKKRMAIAVKMSDVKKAIAKESIKPSLGADLYGKALANTIPNTTTGYQARSLFGRITQQLSNAYRTLDAYDPTRIAEATRIDAGSIKTARQYLDDTNKSLAKYYAQMPESDAQLTADQLAKLKVAVSTSSVAIKTVDALFGTSFWKELAVEVGQGAKVVFGAVGESSKKALVIGGIAAAGILILAIKR